jgi:hypothetical protein
MKSEKTKIIISIILISLGVACRLLPHPFNFAPIAAIALFTGAYLGKRYALTLPIVAMFIGDIFIGFYEWPLMITVYGSFVLIGLLGLGIKRHKSIETVIGASLGASILFFILTNWAVWQFSPWYAHTWSGLLQCYTLALPFFRNTLIGNLFYTGVLFGAYELIAVYYNRRVLCPTK